MFRRRWLQVSLRALLASMVLICVVGAIWKSYVLPYQRQSKAIAKLLEMGIVVQKESAVGPAWLGRLIGPDHFVEISAIRLLDENDPFSASKHSNLNPQEVLRQLREVITLEELDLRGVSIPDDGLRHISHLLNLRVLYLRDSGISDLGLRYVEPLHQLRRLDLNGTEVSDKGLSKLRLPHLEYFSLASPNVNGPGLQFLCESHDLEELQFTGKSATNDWIKYAGPPAGLNWLEFHTTSIDENGVAMLRGCNELQRVYLNHNPIGESVIGTLRLLPKLQVVELFGTNVSDKSVEPLRSTALSIRAK